VKKRDGSTHHSVGCPSRGRHDAKKALAKEGQHSQNAPFLCIAAGEGPQVRPQDERRVHDGQKAETENSCFAEQCRKTWPAGRDAARARRSEPGAAGGGQAEREGDRAPETRPPRAEGGLHRGAEAHASRHSPTGDPQDAPEDGARGLGPPFRLRQRSPRLPPAPLRLCSRWRRIAPIEVDGRAAGIYNPSFLAGGPAGRRDGGGPRRPSGPSGPSSAAGLLRRSSHFGCEGRTALSLAEGGRSGPRTRVKTWYSRDTRT